jgi:phytanoyl-CoA hydroxylase
MVRDKNDQTRFIEMNDEPFELGLAIPLEVSRGSVVLLHGLLPHFSEVNESSMAREAYTLHIIEGDAHYSEDNWLCPEIADPWTGFENP